MSSLLQKLQIFWASQTLKQRRQILILLGCAFCIGYGLWYSELKKSLSHAESMVKRRENRIDRSTASTPKITINTGVLKRSKRELTEELRELKREFQSQRARFVPINDGIAVQGLRRELVLLAKSSGMDIHKFEAMGGGSEEGKAPSADTPIAIDNKYRRAQMQFMAVGSYQSVRQFFDQLDGLSYMVSPVKVNIEAITPDIGYKQALNRKQLLRVDFTLVI